MTKRKLKFIDLFAGLGGFHVALSKLGHTCVMACEIDEELRRVYKQNFNIEPFGDIRELHPSNVPDHDVLCAGFPCQPFSKAGNQLGTMCPRNGDLFADHIVGILKAKKPDYILLENVPNLLRHKSGKTWKRMKRTLEKIGYQVDAKLYSPHEFGVPQKRERVFVVGAREGFDFSSFQWPDTQSKTPVSILDILDTNPKDCKNLSIKQQSIVELWQEFLDRIPLSTKLPSFPIWAAEFDATYPTRGVSPYRRSLRSLAHYKGAFGQPLCELLPQDRLYSLPAYASRDCDELPSWKADFIEQNRQFFSKHRKRLLPWIRKIKNLEPSYQKFEWNCQGEDRDLSNFILQFRASGLRVKRPDFAPSLVAMTLSQVPIIGWEDRYMTRWEAAKLQSLSKLKYLPRTESSAFKALGNAVNAGVVQEVAKALFVTSINSINKNRSSVKAA